jgi:hypothetical protein
MRGGEAFGISSGIRILQDGEIYIQDVGTTQLLTSSPESESNFSGVPRLERGDSIQSWLYNTVPKRAKVYNAQGPTSVYRLCVASTVADARFVHTFVFVWAASIFLISLNPVVMSPSCHRCDADFREVLAHYLKTSKNC